MGYKRYILPIALVALFSGCAKENDDGNADAKSSAAVVGKFNRVMDEYAPYKTQQLQADLAVILNNYNFLRDRIPENEKSPVFGLQSIGSSFANAQMIDDTNFSGAAFTNFQNEIYAQFRFFKGRENLLGDAKGGPQNNVGKLESFLEDLKEFNRQKAMQRKAQSMQPSP